ncbi:MAG: hypothetical protein V3W17_03260 [Desulfobacteria bacterium]|jgi:hypothetical protein
MKEFLTDKEDVKHLPGYAIWTNEDGGHEHVTVVPRWKSRNLVLVRGLAWKLGDVLGLGEQEEERETTDSAEQIWTELEKHPTWNRTKYYCFIYDYITLGFVYYCESSQRVNEAGEDYRAAEEILRHYGIERRVRSMF